MVGREAPDGWMLRINSTDQFQHLVQGVSGVMAAGTVPESVPTVITYSYGSAGAWVLRIDGVEARPARTMRRRLARSFMTIGAGDGSFEPFTGLIGEIVIYDEAYTGTDLTDIEDYLTDKWIFAGANYYDETDLPVAVVTSVTATSRVDLNDIPVLLSSTATYTATNRVDFNETPVSLPIAATFTAPTQDFHARRKLQRDRAAALHCHDGDENRRSCGQQDARELSVA